MTRLSDFLRKQGHLLLENDRIAIVYAVVLALIPFAAWLSIAIVALVTLRKGWYAGLVVMGAGALSLLCISLLARSLPAALISVLVAYLPCYLTACVLRATASWRITGAFIVLLALLIIVLVQLIVPEFIVGQYQLIRTMILKEVESTGPVADFLNNQDTFEQAITASYLIGIQVLAIVMSAMASLMLARSVQSGLFYPGGFKQEMISFRASALGTILLIACIAGVYQHNLIAISCLPLLVAYYAGAGISLSFYILAKERGWGILILLLLPLIFVPFVMLPVYVIIGALDSLFNFRMHLRKADGKQNKG